MANRYELWQNAWRPEPHTPLTVELPADWDSCLYDMEADRIPPLTEEQLRETLRNPLGSPPIRELARRGRTAVIVFDDMSRGTPVAPWPIWCWRSWRPAASQETRCASSAP